MSRRFIAVLVALLIATPALFPAAALEVPAHVNIDKGRDWEKECTENPSTDLCRLICESLTKTQLPALIPEFCGWSYTPKGVSEDCWDVSQTILNKKLKLFYTPALPNKHCLPFRDPWCEGDFASCTVITDLPAQFGCGGIRARIDCSDKRQAIFDPLDGGLRRPILIPFPEQHG